MELIYADSNKIELGIIEDTEFDLAYGKDENNFSLKLALSSHCCEDDYLIYMIDTEGGFESGTEYGGVIDAISVNTSEKSVTYSGRTWHGILGAKIIMPDEGCDYCTVNGNAHDVIVSLIKRSGLSDFFTVENYASEINVYGYSFARFVDMYTGITQMLASCNGKLLARYDNRQKKVVLSAIWLVDYSFYEDWDSSQVNFQVTQTKNPVNHLICLGQGNLKDRAVIHLFTDRNGGVQPYAKTASPVKDDDYILDTRNQQLFGANEVAETFDDPSAAITENYVLLTSQPSDWAYNYSSYFLKTANGYEEPKATTQETLTVLSSKPADWDTRYGNYFTSDGKSVQGVETTNYNPVYTKPSDWEKNWASYVVHFWDGNAYSWQPVESVSYNEYVVMTSMPDDWFDNWQSYYVRSAADIVIKRNGKDKGKLVKLGTNFVPLSSVELKERPKWYADKYAKAVSKQKAPDFATSNYNLTKYFVRKTTTAPAWTGGTYYTKQAVTTIPVFMTGVYYQLFYDRYAELVKLGLERLKEKAEDCDKISINLSLLGEYDIGDIVGAVENTTGIIVWQPITKKIVSIKNKQKQISYKIGASS